MIIKFLVQFWLYLYVKIKRYPIIQTKVLSALTMPHAIFHTSQIRIWGNVFWRTEFPFRQCFWTNVALSCNFFRYLWGCCCLSDCSGVIAHVVFPDQRFEHKTVVRVISFGSVIRVLNAIFAFSQSCCWHKTFLAVGRQWDCIQYYHRPIWMANPWQILTHTMVLSVIKFGIIDMQSEATLQSSVA